MKKHKVVSESTKEDFNKVMSKLLNNLWVPIYETYNHSLAMTTQSGVIQYAEKFTMLFAKTVPAPPEMCGTCKFFLKSRTEYDCIEADDEVEIDPEGWCDKYERKMYEMEED